jgi:hypothetical protein
MLILVHAFMVLCLLWLFLPVVRFLMGCLVLLLLVCCWYSASAGHDLRLLRDTAQRADEIANRA